MYFYYNTIYTIRLIKKFIFLVFWYSIKIAKISNWQTKNSEIYLANLH